MSLHWSQITWAEPETLDEVLSSHLLNALVCPPGITLPFSGNSSEVKRIMKENTGADMCEMCSLTCLRGLVVYGTETKACEVRGGTPVFCIFNLILSYEVIISQ